MISDINYHLSYTQGYRLLKLDDTKYNNKDRLKNIKGLQLINNRIKRTLWDARYIYGLDTEVASKLSVNGYLQLSFCSLKEDLQDLDDNYPNEYAKNYKIEGASSKDKIETLDKIIKLGYTQSKDEYIQTYLNFYNQQFNVITNYPNLSTTSRTLIMYSEFIDTIPLFYEPKEINYNLEKVQEVVKSLKDEVKQINQIATASLDEIYSNHDVIKFKQIVLDNYKICLNKSNIPFNIINEGENSHNKKFLLIKKIITIKDDNLTDLQKTNQKSCEKALDKELDTSFRDYYKSKNPEMVPE